MNESVDKLLRDRIAQASIEESQRESKMEELRVIERTKLDELAIPETFQMLVELLQSKDPETYALKQRVARALNIVGEQVQKETTDDLFVTLRRTHALGSMRKYVLLAKVDTAYDSSGDIILLAKPMEEEEMIYTDGSYVYIRDAFNSPEDCARRVFDFIEAPFQDFARYFSARKSFALGKVGIKTMSTTHPEATWKIDNNAGKVRNRIVALLKI